MEDVATLNQQRIGVGSSNLVEGLTT